MINKEKCACSLLVAKLFMGSCPHVQSLSLFARADSVVWINPYLGAGHFLRTAEQDLVNQTNKQTSILTVLLRLLSTNLIFIQVTQDLLSKQKKIKYLDQVKSNKYKMLCKTEEGAEKVRTREVITFYYLLFVPRSHI